jgi:Tfp pilus assembly protein PilX
MKRKYFSNNRGVLLVSVMFMYGLIILASVILGKLVYNTRIASVQFDKVQAYYMAMAGINKAEYYLANTAPNASKDGSYRTTNTYASGNAGVTEALGTGTYEFWIDTVSASLNTIKLTSKGTYNNLTKTVQVTVNYRSYLEMWLKFNEQYGAVALDSSGNGNYMTFGATGQTGPTWHASAKLSGGLYFNGSSGHLVFANSKYLTVPHNAVTLAAWFKSTNFSNTGLITGDTAHGINNQGRWAFRAYTYVGYIVGKNVTGYQSVAITGNTVLTVNQWNHYALTLDTTNTPQMYANGTQQSGYSGVSISTYTYGSVYKIGAGYGNTMSGTIDDVRVYSRALTSAEISAIYNGGSGTESSTVVTPWGYITQVPGSFVEL